MATYDPPDHASMAAHAKARVGKLMPGVYVGAGYMPFSGGPRDTLGISERVEAQMQVWRDWDAALGRGVQSLEFGSGDGPRGEPLVITGPMGSGTTALSAYVALEYLERGHCVFSNAPFLFGWRLGASDLLAAIPEMPVDSVVVLEDAFMPQRLGDTVVAGAMADHLLNSRKRGLKFIISTKQDYNLHPSIRLQARQVFKVESTSIDPPGITWRRSDDYPYVSKEEDPSVESRDVIKRNLRRYLRDEQIPPEPPEPPPFTRVYTKGSDVRRALLLIDSFGMALG